MKRLAVLALLFAATAWADDGSGTDVDDHPLAGDLRATFGRDVSVCHGDDCTLDLPDVECTTRGSATTCRAGKRTARGSAAAQLAAHLHDMTDYEDRETPPAGGSDRVAVAHVTCRAYKLDGQAMRRGHCGVERRAGDGEIDAVLAGLAGSDGTPILEMCKLGQFCWTGTVHVACTRRACALSCPAHAEDAQWLDACRLDPAGKPVVVTDAAFAKRVVARLGGAAGTLSCYTSGGSIDGGLTSLVACNALRDRK